MKGYGGETAKGDVVKSVCGILFVVWDDDTHGQSLMSNIAVIDFDIFAKAAIEVGGNQGERTKLLAPVFRRPPRLRSLKMSPMCRRQQGNLQTHSGLCPFHSHTTGIFLRCLLHKTFQEAFCTV